MGVQTSYCIYTEVPEEERVQTAHVFRILRPFASRPQLMTRVPWNVYRAILAHLITTSGFIRKTAQTGAVTLIQRFGSALNLNVHFHMLFLDGVYTTTLREKADFIGPMHPISRNSQNWCVRSATALPVSLEPAGILRRDEENSYLGR